MRGPAGAGTRRVFTGAATQSTGELPQATTSELGVMLNSDIANRAIVFDEQLLFRKRFDLFKCRKPSFVCSPLAFPRNRIQLFTHSLPQPLTSRLDACLQGKRVVVDLSKDRKYPGGSLIERGI